MQIIYDFLDGWAHVASVVMWLACAYIVGLTIYVEFFVKDEESAEELD